MTLLSLQNISKIYNSNVGNFEVFKEINFEIDENENVFLSVSYTHLTLPTILLV